MPRITPVEPCLFSVNKKRTRTIHTKPKQAKPTGKQAKINVVDSKPLREDRVNILV